MNNIVKFIVLAFAAFLILAGISDGEEVAIIIGFAIIGFVFFSKIKKISDNIVDSKNQNDMLKVRELYEKGILTEEEYDSKMKKLKENF